jgi:hypothetical protein
MNLPINIERSTTSSGNRQLAALRRSQIPYRFWVRSMRQDLCYSRSSFPDVAVSSCFSVNRARILHGEYFGDICGFWQVGDDASRVFWISRLGCQDRARLESLSALSSRRPPSFFLYTRTLFLFNKVKQVFTWHGCLHMHRMKKFRSTQCFYFACEFGHHCSCHS